MDMSQCYAGSGLLYFSLDLNSRKSLFGPLVSLGMPKRPISPLLAQTVSFPVGFLPLLPVPHSYSYLEFSLS